VFPDDEIKDKETRNATGVIRLITRLMFVWFLKEKNLVPEELFDDRKLKSILKFSDKKKSTFYKAILQNLFFATLNTEMDKRKFRRKNEQNRDGHYFIQNVFRYEDEFIEPNKTLESYFDPIPFLNGGLFECLDKQIEEKGKLKSIRIDGFSDRDDNVLKVSDDLFFGAEKTVDLTAFYNPKSKRKQHYKVRGLIHILDSYKFTITENTPIDEEIALDPELLGKVFENLLANYNPETKTTARKQTGSFYTPREIVNYMVDESLIAYMKQQLDDNDETEAEIRMLLSYSEKEAEFTEEQKDKLIRAIDDIKILDPACGSGAFPMGVLHKLVHILHKIDPKNQKWEQRQLNKVDKLIAEAEEITDTKTRNSVIADLQKNREGIIEAFENNELDYGRKLFLIENCIYGVDIQAIAAQISKLRFFISLIVDQRTDDKKENLGIRPLPNLETKFIAANTLIELEKENANLFTNPEIETKKAELKKVRHKYFEARTPKTKEKYREDDKRLRNELADILTKDHYLQPAAAKKLALWDPYDQNASASFFDSEWMFGLNQGFEVIIGNPPYKVVNKTEQKLYNGYSTLNCGDLYAYFFEKVIKDLLKLNGALSYITASLYIKGIKFDTLRYFLEKNIDLISLQIQGDDVFDNVQMPTATFIGRKSKIIHNNWSFEDFIPNGKLIKTIDEESIPLSKISGVMRGFEIGRDKVSTSGSVKFLTGSDIRKWSIKHISYISRETENHYRKNEHFFIGERILIRETGSELTVLYLEKKLYCNRSLYSIKVNDPKYSTKYLAAILNSKVCQFYYQSKFRSDTELFPKIRIAQVNQLPIKHSENQELFEKIVDYILFIRNRGNNSSFFERLIDAMVYEIYLPKQIKSAAAEVLKHLNDLPELTEDDEKNLKIIDKVQKELSDPKHPVSLAMFKMDAVEEIRIIEEKED
jgi:hypothetical protein